ncbi:MAG: GTP-sensing pleiotropic transcriptional regulator CodY [Defluviitaleaceae bacterium]|nr:GTP-sensing pleiotropic transcriptional regulator CodY [Defluviitaleaceae bacterium]
MQYSPRQTIYDAIKRSLDYADFIKILAEDLGNALNASVRIVDDRGALVLRTEPLGGLSDLELESVVLPIVLSGERTGGLELGRKKAFNEDELKYGELISSFITLVILGIENSRPKSSDVKAALSTLSYSELEAVIHVVGELSESEGVLIAKKIADEHNLGRSAIVNGLRKLESAGLIETRSLGVKGTHIKILNERLTTELDKFNKRR